MNAPEPNVKAMVAKKKKVAATAVERDRKLAEPEAPKMEPLAPLPKAAPRSAPLPCCNKTKMITAIAEMICTTIAIETNMEDIFIVFL